MSTTPSHYFDEQPAMGSSPRIVEVALPGGSLTLETDRGVFGHGQLDPGSKLLLVHAEAPAATGDLLDLGCGTGALAISMARRSPQARVWAVDVNERARRLCAANAVRNGVSNLTVAAPDDVPADLRFSTMWSNPPIRIGKPQLHTLLTRWLDRLAVGGAALMVVHKHLGADSLEGWLNTEGYPTQRVRTAAGYRLLVSHPRRIDHQS